MSRYRLITVVVFALAVAVLALAGGATRAHAKTSHVAQARTGADSICTIRSLKTFVEAGEFATHSSVANVVQVGCDPGFSGQTVTIRAQQVYNRCNGHLSWSSPFPVVFHEGPAFDVTLDNDGNATAVFWGGPACASGDSLMTAHLNTAPFSTVTTHYTIRPPQDTPPGVFAMPRKQIEDGVYSSAATVIYVEFPPVYAERFVDISSGELYARCQVPPHVVWVGPDQAVLGADTDTVRVQLDNNGNAFVVALAGASCAAGRSHIEASLVGPPNTTYETTFKILSPRPLLFQ